MSIFSGIVWGTCSFHPRERKSAVKTLLIVLALCCPLAVSAAPSQRNFVERGLTLDQYVEKSTPIVKYFRNREGMTVRLSGVFWNDSPDENFEAYKDFTFFEVLLRQRGFVKDMRSACELEEINRSSLTHCSIETWLYRTTDGQLGILIQCNGRQGREFILNRYTSKGAAKNFFENEQQAITRSLRNTNPFSDLESIFRR